MLNILKIRISFLMIHLSSSKLKIIIYVILLGCISLGCLDRGNSLDEHFILVKDFKNLLYQYDGFIQIRWR